MRQLLGICLTFATLLTAIDRSKAQPVHSERSFAIVIHGGAGANPQRLSATAQSAYLKSLEKALQAGYTSLAAGHSSLETVELVVRLMEDDPIFNAGKGAVMNAAGTHELDASIMDGSTKACGAVAGVKRVKNPIGLARLVMTRTPHVLLAAEGADQFAQQQQVELVENKYFWTQKAQDSLDRVRRKAKPGAEFKGTVGCVALDQSGNLAAATSTGGLTNKRFGRVGDSPIIGAGTYADNATCAVSCTGTGEHYIRHAIAHDVAARMEYGKQPLVQAAKIVIHQKLKPGDGGLIAVGRDGAMAVEHNTGGIAYGMANGNGVFRVGLTRRE